MAAFTRAGLPAAQRWSTLLPPGEESFWLDPQGSEFGENAKYFRYDPAEAKKLLQAIGAGVIDQSFTFVGGPVFGQSYTDDVEVLRGMWEATGDFKLRANPVDFATVFNPRYVFNSPSRDFEGKGGIAMIPSPDAAEVDGILSGYTPSAGVPASSPISQTTPVSIRWCRRNAQSSTRRSARLCCTTCSATPPRGFTRSTGRVTAWASSFCSPGS
jgi:ABC-type transport system substrate-binding protein